MHAYICMYICIYIYIQTHIYLYQYLYIRPNGAQWICSSISPQRNKYSARLFVRLAIMLIVTRDMTH